MYTISTTRGVTVSFITYMREYTTLIRQNVFSYTPAVVPQRHTRLEMLF